MALVYGLLLASVFVAFFLIFVVMKKYLSFVRRFGTTNPLAVFIGLCILAFLSCASFAFVDIVAYKLSPKTGLPSEFHSYPFLYVTRGTAPVFKYHYIKLKPYHTIDSQETLLANSDFVATIFDARYDDVPKYHLSDEVILTKVRYIRGWFDNDTVGYVSIDNIAVVGFLESIFLYPDYLLSYFLNFGYVLFLLKAGALGLLWSAFFGAFPGKIGTAFLQIRGSVYFAIGMMEAISYGVLITPFLILINMLLAGIAGDLLIWLVAKRFPRIEGIRRAKGLLYASLK